MDLVAIVAAVIVDLYSGIIRFNSATYSSLLRICSYLGINRSFISYQFSRIPHILTWGKCREKVEDER